MAQLPNACLVQVVFRAGAFLDLASSDAEILIGAFEDCCPYDFSNRANVSHDRA